MMMLEKVALLPLRSCRHRHQSRGVCCRLRHVYIGRGRRCCGATSVGTGGGLSLLLAGTGPSCDTLQT